MNGNYFHGNPFEKQEDNFQELVQDVIDWAKGNGLLYNTTSEKQLLKSFSEMGELADALLKKDYKGIKDGIGDTLVTLILVAYNVGINLEECLQYAYDQIKDRKGKMIDGTFVKEENDA